MKSSKIELAVTYVDMTPAQYVVWRKQLADLYVYVEEIGFDSLLANKESGTGDADHRDLE